MEAGAGAGAAGVDGWGQSELYTGKGGGPEGGRLRARLMTRR